MMIGARDVRDISHKRFVGETFRALPGQTLVLQADGSQFENCVFDFGGGGELRVRGDKMAFAGCYFYPATWTCKKNPLGHNDGRT